jgi:hypothetical protein
MSCGEFCDSSAARFLQYHLLAVNPIHAIRRRGGVIVAQSVLVLSCFRHCVRQGAGYRSLVDAAVAFVSRALLQILKLARTERMMKPFCSWWDQVHIKKWRDG